MALMTWGPTLQLGYGDIDNQHKRLVELVNELDEAMRMGKGREVLGHVLSGLVDYTVYHFSFEEKLMDEYDVPSAEYHKNEHRQLVEDVSSLKAKFDSGTASVTTELMVFLRNWLSTHILKTDKTLVRELLAKGARSAA